MATSHVAASTESVSRPRSSNSAMSQREMEETLSFSPWPIRNSELACVGLEAGFRDGRRLANSCDALHHTM